MPDNVSFNAIPIDIRTPGQFIEIDNTNATGGIPQQAQTILVLGQRLAAAPVIAEVPTQIFSGTQGAAFFGRGSMLARMIAAARAANPSTEMWAIALDDLAAGVAASGTLTVTGAPSAGTLALMIGGTEVMVGVAAAEQNSVTATNIAAAINANLDLPVTAAANLGVVTVTARHKGECGNDIDMRLNYYNGEMTPQGLAVAISAMANGTGNPDVAGAIAAIGGDQYYTIIMPWTDAANMSEIETFLTTNWGPMVQKTGHSFSAVNGTLATLGTYGTARNSPHSTVMGIYDMPIEPCITAAVLGAVCQYYGSIDPARPFQTLQLPGLLPPPMQSQFTRDDRDLLLHDGISTFTVDAGGNVLIERVITTYQTNSLGIADVSYLDLNTVWTVDAIRYAIRARIALRFPRFKLADDGTNFAPGQAIVTPSIIAAELVQLASDLEQAGLIENLTQFKQDLLVVRSTANVDQVNAVIPPNIVNQFRVFAASVQFIL